MVRILEIFFKGACPRSVAFFLVRLLDILVFFVFYALILEGFIQVLLVLEDSQDLYYEGWVRSC